MTQRCTWGIGFALLVVSSGCETPRPTSPPRPESPRARDYRSSHVTAALRAARRVVETRGFALDGDEWRGFLVEHGTSVSDASLRSGSCYVVVATASSGLRELDLVVYDTDGGEVARDSDTGGHAAVRYCPAQTGTYYATARASAGSGVFAVQRFKGPTGLTVRIDDVFRGVAEASDTRRNGP